MTEKHTPEKVAELTAKAKQFRDALAGIDQAQDMSDGSIISLWLRTADALTAVSAERDAAQRKARMIPKRLRADRDRLHRAITEALATAPKLGELRWRNVDRMIGILRAALDQEGND